MLAVVQYLDVRALIQTFNKASPCVSRQDSQVFSRLILRQHVILQSASQDSPSHALAPGCYTPDSCSITLPLRVQLLERLLLSARSTSSLSSPPTSVVELPSYISRNSVVALSDDYRIHQSRVFAFIRLIQGPSWRANAYTINLVRQSRVHDKVTRFYP